MKKEAREVIHGAVQDWQEYETALQAKALKQRCRGRVAKRPFGRGEVTQPTAIINIATKVLSQSNKIRVGRVVSTVEKRSRSGGMIRDGNKLKSLCG